MCILPVFYTGVLGKDIKALVERHQGLDERHQGCGERHLGLGERHQGMALISLLLWRLTSGTRMSSIGRQSVHCSDSGEVLAMPGGNYCLGIYRRGAALVLVLCVDLNVKELEVHRGVSTCWCSDTRGMGTAWADSNAGCVSGQRSNCVPRVPLYCCASASQLVSASEAHRLLYSHIQCEYDHAKCALIKVPYFPISRVRGERVIQVVCW